MNLSVWKRFAKRLQPPREGLTWTCGVHVDFPMRHHPYNSGNAMIQTEQGGLRTNRPWQRWPRAPRSSRQCRRPIGDQQLPPHCLTALYNPVVKGAIKHLAMKFVEATVRKTY